MTSFSSRFVSTEWLQDHLFDEDIRIVDATVLYDPSKYENGRDHVRSGKDGYLDAHIPGATFADLFDLNDSDAEIPFTFSDPQALADKLAELGLGERGTTTIIYDRGPIVGADLPASFWASRLAWQMQQLGIENIKLLDGGFSKWLREDRPVANMDEIYPAIDSLAVEFTNFKVDDQEVLQAIEDEQTVIIDCLSPDQYAGITNPYEDGNNGHIPTSENVFFASLGDFESGELLDESQIRQTFDAVGALDSDKEVITYCGFGIAATWVQYLLNALGQDRVKVYDGSMNDWHAKDLPVEKA